MNSFIDELESLLKSDKGVKAVSALEYSKNDEDIISTGLLPLDINLGGGITRGTMMSIYGPASNGKSTLADSIIVSWLNSNPKALVYRVESERCMDPNRLLRMGADLSRIKVLVKEKSLILEQCFDQIQAFQDLIYGKFGDEVPLLIEWDTISSAIPETEANDDKWGAGMMIGSRIVTQGLRKLNARLANYKHSCILIQQVMSGGKDRMGNEIYKTSDVQAYKHVPSVILEVRRSQGKDRQIYNSNNEIIGSEVDVKIHKNKITGLDKRSVDLAMYMTSGFSKIDSIIMYATSGKCSKNFSGAGAWIQIYDHKGNEYKKINGKNKLAEELKKDPYLLTLVEWCGYKYFSEQDPLYAAKFKDKLDNLTKKLDKLLNGDIDDETLKKLSELETFNLPENFGKLDNSEIDIIEE